MQNKPDIFANHSWGLILLNNFTVFRFTDCIFLITPQEGNYFGSSNIHHHYIASFKQHLTCNTLLLQLIFFTLFGSISSAFAWPRKLFISLTPYCTQCNCWVSRMSIYKGHPKKNKQRRENHYEKGSVSQMLPSVWVDKFRTSCWLLWCKMSASVVCWPLCPTRNMLQLHYHKTLCRIKWD